MDKSGIYAIVNSFTGDCYIGSALVLRKRRNSHFHALRNGKHDSIYLQRAWAKYGSDAFYFKPFIVCRQQDLIYFEQRALDVLKPRYNMRTLAGSNLGAKFSDVAKAKMRAAKLSKKLTAAHRAALSVASKGKKKGPITETHRENLRRSHLGQINPSKGKPSGKTPPNKGMGVSYEGVTLVEWTKRLGLGKNTLYERIRKSGMSVQQAVLYVKY